VSSSHGEGDLGENFVYIFTGGKLLILKLDLENPLGEKQLDVKEKSR